ncbi:hypothetical protein EDB85DRAFT_441517 [Lactarius pseudohatsudake]|nr:hypothetical protein EDB85DRAFT_441517 [Lactarius pseudohatsudake]
MTPLAYSSTILMQTSFSAPVIPRHFGCSSFISSGVPLFLGHGFPKSNCLIAAQSFPVYSLCLLAFIFPVPSVLHLDEKMDHLSVAQKYEMRKE